MAQTVTPPAARPRRASLFAYLEPLIGVFNPVAVRFAGTRLVPFFSVIRHVGRRSGRTYATPVAARRTASGFAIPLAYGEGADWSRNMIAAGRAVVRWKGKDYPVTDPVVVDRDAAMGAFSGLEWRGLKTAGIQRVMLVSIASD